jgi:hypothetical protein
MTSNKRPMEYMVVIYNVILDNIFSKCKLKCVHSMQKRTLLTRSKTV